jgi:hypothetical protein
MIEGSIRIFRRCPAFGIYEKGKGRSRCCCCGVGRRRIAFRLKGKRIGSSSISLKPVSTMGPRSCWPL